VFELEGGFSMSQTSLDIMRECEDLIARLEGIDPVLALEGKRALSFDEDRALSYGRLLDWHRAARERVASSRPPHDPR
jgi:hypothetical protein